MSSVDFSSFLKLMVHKKASDLFITAGLPPSMKVNGRIQPITQTALTAQQSRDMVLNVMTPSQREEFEKTHECNFAISMQGVGRFRVSCFYQRNQVGMVLRRIETRIPTCEELNLPPIIKTLAMTKRGIILFVGATGTGKSTSLAAMIDYINTKRNCHIVTIEDPIEYLHRDKKSIINQREVGSDTNDFSKALRSALRQDPDVILVGEMRDLETIETALLAAETGHLVLSTLHTLDAPETINRIISMFAPHHQKQIRIQLAAVLKSIISMRLLPRSDDKGRVPAVEILISTPFIQDCIVTQEKTKMIKESIAQGISQYGMQTFDQSLYSLYQKNFISFDEALKWASNPDEFKLKKIGVQSAKDMSMEEMEKRMSEIGGSDQPDKLPEDLNPDHNLLEID